MSKSDPCVRTFVHIVHRIFNTNNLWVNLKAIQKLLLSNQLHMEVIVNQKVCVLTGVAKGSSM